MLLPSDPFAAAAFLGLVAGSAYVTLSKRTPKALGFAVLTLAAFLAQVVDLLFVTGGRYMLELGFTTPDLLEGDWWRLLSYMFVHDPGFRGRGVLSMHVVGNLFILATAGPVLEDRIGGKTWVALYLGGGALTVLSHVLLFPDARVLAIGASGAIFAVVGCLAIVAPKARIPVPLFFIFWFPAWGAALFFTALNAAYALAPVRGVAWYAHFAGMALGIAAGAFLVKRVPQPDAPLRDRLDPASLRPLATTRRGEQFLERYAAVKGETPDDRTWAEAWLEKFLAEAQCPTCGAKGLARKDGTVTCPNGHATPVAKAV